MTISEILALPKTDPRWLEFERKVNAEAECPCVNFRAEEGSIEEFNRYIADDR